MSAVRYDEFFLVWESSCRNFIEEVKFASHDAKTSRLKLHVFLRKDTPVKALPPVDIWVENHFSLTTSPYASDTGLISHILGKYGNLSDLDDEDIISRTVYLVSERERQYDELIAILKSSNPKVDVREVDGRENSIFEVVKDSCRFCQLIFSNEEETKEHNIEQHNFFCDNPSCYGYQQRFRSEQALLKHKTAQTTCLYCEEVFCSKDARIKHLKQVHNINNEAFPKRAEKKAALVKHVKIVQSELKISCQFCPRKEFSSLDQKEIHMKNSHKKCNCSCGEYFETREEYLDHFYSVYPLPCYENRKCPHRFQTVFLQAEHHRDFHNSQSPFYCVPCQKRKVEDGVLVQATKTSFKDENGLRIHGISMGHNEAEMFLSDLMDTLNANTPVQRRAPSRTCSNLNYC